MTLRTIVVTCVAAAFLLGGTAWAQSCPAGLTNPLNLLANTTWAFRTDDGQVGDATVGLFTATIGTSTRGPGAGTPLGVLSVVESFNNGGFTEEQAQIPGSYTINPDCSGGNLIINSAQNGYQYQFVFNTNFTKMFLLTNMAMPNNGIGPFEGNRGVAFLQPNGAPSCAGVTQPLSLLAGTWGFQTEDFASATIGILNAAVATTTRNPGAGSIVGALGAVETFNGAGFGGPGATTQAPVGGMYSIYSDCSGGHISLPTGEATQYSFFFNGPNEILLVSLSGVSPTGGVFRGNFGVADRF